MTNEGENTQFSFFDNLPGEQSSIEQKNENYYAQEMLGRKRSQSKPKNSGSQTHTVPDINPVKPVRKSSGIGDALPSHDKD